MTVAYFQALLVFEQQAAPIVCSRLGRTRAALWVDEA